VEQVDGAAAVPELGSRFFEGDLRAPLQWSKWSRCAANSRDRPMISQRTAPRPGASRSAFGVTLSDAEDAGGWLKPPFASRCPPQSRHYVGVWFVAYGPLAK
jgi:hypothetical protein